MQIHESAIEQYYPLLIDDRQPLSVYSVPALTYLLETKIVSIVEYQLKCRSVADNAAPDCCIVWSGAGCCRQGHQRVTWTAARLCESWWTTLRTFALSRELLFDWFYRLSLLAWTLWLAHSQIVACFTRYSCNMWSQVWWAEWHRRFITRFFWHVSAKIIKFIWQTCCTQ